MKVIWAVISCGHCSLLHRKQLDFPNCIWIWKKKSQQGKNKSTIQFMNCLMLSLIHFQGKKEVTQSGKTFFVVIWKYLFWNGLNRSNGRISVCVCMHAHMYACAYENKKSNCWFLFFSKCQECKVLVMFSGRAMPSLDFNHRCTEQLGTARWLYSTCFTFLRGSDVVQWKQQEKESKMLKLEGTLGPKPW